MQAKLSMGVSVRDGLCTSVAPERRHDAKSSENSTIFSLSARVASPPPQHMISKRSQKHSRHRRTPHPRRREESALRVRSDYILYHHVYVLNVFVPETGVWGDAGVGARKRTLRSLFCFISVHKPVNPLNQPFNFNVQKYKKFFLLCVRSFLSLLNGVGKNGT